MKEFILPDIGEGIVECELLAWLVKEGEEIEEDQPVAEVMTDKATVQIPAMYKGKVGTLHYKEGEIAKVHQPLFSMIIEAERELSGHENVATDSIENQKLEMQVEDFILPDIGEGIVECEIVKWSVQEGEKVEEDQVVVEVMTDKAVVEIPAKHQGILTKHYYAEGEIAKVHTPLFALSTNTQVIAPVHSELAKETNSTVASVNESTKSRVLLPQGKALASPAVRRVARENNIDLSQVKGSGKKGRVLKEDLLACLEANNHQQSSKPVVSLENKVEPIRGVRAAMAKQMQLSVSTIPHFSVSEEICLDELSQAKNAMQKEAALRGTKLGFMPFMIKALSMAMMEFPIINSRVNEACTELTYLAQHNVGIAVDTSNGLVVPNIKGVESMSLFDVAEEYEQLVAKARDGKLTSSDFKEGTVTISNIGVLGGTVATPVINKPEVAIVAMGKIQTLPRFDQAQNVCATKIMNVSWSGDHRIIDGATMVKFNNLWKELIESPTSMLAKLL